MKDRNRHREKTEKFSEIFQAPPLRGGLGGDIKDLILSASDLRSQNLDVSLWLRDREVVK
jgi:hypothetical protein